MRTPLITIFVVCVLLIGLALAFYDYKKYGLHEKPMDISRSQSDTLKKSRELAEQKTYEKDYDSAVEQYKKAIQLSPRDAYLHNDLGATYYYLGLKSMTPPVEEDEFGFGVEVDARHINDTNEILKKVESAVGQVESGIITVVVKDKAISQMVENLLRPLNHYIHIEEENTDSGDKEFWMTIIKGKTKEAFLNAEKEYLQAIDLRSIRDAEGRKYSNYSAASRNLGTLYFRMGRRKEALAQWRRALQLEPTDAELRELIGKYE